MSLVDSLPYYDAEPTEAEREAVDALVEAEIPRYTPLHPSLQQQQEVEWTPSSLLIQQEIDRIKRGEKLQAIDLSRYEDIEMPQTASLKDYRCATRRNIVAATAMVSRSDNLALLKSLGSNAWTMHVHQVEYSLKQVESELLALRQDVDQVNIDRKKSQVAAGERLSELEERWRSLISGNLELNVACLVLQRELDDLAT